MDRRALIMAAFLVQAMHSILSDDADLRVLGPLEPIAQNDYNIQVINNLNPQKSHWAKFRCFAGINGTNWVHIGDQFTLKPGELSVMTVFHRRESGSLQIKCRFQNEVARNYPRDNVILFDSRWKDINHYCEYHEGGCQIVLATNGNNNPSEMYLYANKGTQMARLGDIPDSVCGYLDLLLFSLRLTCHKFGPERYQHDLVGVDCRGCPFNILGITI